MARHPRVIVAALLLAATARAAVAQTISGVVQGADKPVVGATVRLLELDRVQRTGAHGEFSFTGVPKGSYTLFAGADGYAGASKAIDVTGASGTVTFDLKLSAVALRAVVVSASPMPRASTDEYQSVDSKSEVDLLNTAGTSFAEKLSDLPGVTVRGNGSAPSRPILRGLTDNEVLIVENGLRMGDIATYDPAHATPLEALGIAQVDVVRGPAAILYGPNTLGGLVNVITNIVPAVADHPLSGTVNVEGNSVSSEYSGFVRNIWSTQSSAFSVSAGGLHAGDIGIPAGTYTGTAQARFVCAQGNAADRRAQQRSRSRLLASGRLRHVGIGAKHFEINYGVPGDPPNADWLDQSPTTSTHFPAAKHLQWRSLFNAGGSFIRQVKLNAAFNDYTHSEFPTAEDSTGVSDPQANHFHKQTFNAVLQARAAPTAICEARSVLDRCRGSHDRG